MNKRENFKAVYPDSIFLDGSEIDELQDYLRNVHFIPTNEFIESCSIPGAGNMNYVIRVKTNTRTFIVKQARPWVEKYPSIEAPIQRIHVEIEFYTAISNSETLSKSSPEILFIDKSSYLFILEDLGDIEDFSFIYQQDRRISDMDITKLAQYLSALHQIEVEDFPLNSNMRALNFEHIFDIPFTAHNGLDLEKMQAGLQALALREQMVDTIKEAILSLGNRYLATGLTLLHGDFYPGSWMKSDTLYVLDPEFAFCGPVEFDLGVCIAHLYMAQQSENVIQLFLHEYELTYDTYRVMAYAGIEIIRRLLGVAQLPLDLEIAKKKELIDKSINWIKMGKL